MTKTQKNVFLVSVMGAVIILVYLFGLQTQKVGASSPAGIPATMATSSTAAVSTTATSVIATSTCTARIIATGALSGIMITFTDFQGAVPSATVGFWQPASTTVAYDAGLYGCGTVRVYSSSSQTINVADVR